LASVVFLSFFLFFFHYSPWDLSGVFGQAAGCVGLTPLFLLAETISFFFRSGFRKYFNGIFELVMQRNGKKRDKKIKGEK
jgi:hypothetical protein